MAGPTESKDCRVAGYPLGCACLPGLQRFSRRDNITLAEGLPSANACKTGGPDYRLSWCRIEPTSPLLDIGEKLSLEADFSAPESNASLPTEELFADAGVW